MFDRVQEILESRTAANERQRKHHHYLKGSLWCWPCHYDGRESRIILQKATGNGGIYWYFFCRGRRQHTCTQPYWSMDEVEDAVLRHYATVRLEPDFADQVRAAIQRTVDERDQATRLLQKQLKAQLAKLDVREENLLDLAEDGELPKAKVRRRLTRIAEQRKQLQNELAEADTQIDVGVALLEANARTPRQPSGVLPADHRRGSSPPEPGCLREALSRAGGHRGRPDQAAVPGNHRGPAGRADSSDHRPPAKRTGGHRSGLP